MLDVIYRGLTQAVFLHLRLRHATLNISKNNLFVISHLYLVEGETEEVERWDRVDVIEHLNHNQNHLLP